MIHDHIVNACATKSDFARTVKLSQQIPQSVKLKFDDKHIERIFSGEKTVTFRVGMDSSRFEVGDPILLCNSGGEWFAESEVVARGYTSVEMAAFMSFDGHRDYDDVDDLLEELRGYYPDEEIGANTRIDFVEWGELW